MSEKGIIFDIKKYAIHDGPGIRTTVFFKGCPLNCCWCHNPESRKLALEPIKGLSPRGCLTQFSDNGNEMIGRKMTVDQILNEIQKDVIFYDESGGGVTFSGGEPLMQPEFLLSLLQLSRENEIHTMVDTSGYAKWQVFERIVDVVDGFLYDLKLIDDNVHRKYTGVSNQLILENLPKLAKLAKSLTIRIPLIPDITDTNENIVGIINYLHSLTNIRKIDLLPYNIIGENKYQKLGQTYAPAKRQVQSQEKLNHIKHKFEAAGFEVKIGG